MSVGSIIGGGVRLVRTQPRVVAAWGAVYLVVALVGMVAMRPWMGAMVAFQQQAAAEAAAGGAPPTFPAAWFGWLFVVELAFAILLVVAFAAVVRAVARPGGDRYAYLRFGKDELRLFGLGVILTIAAILAEIVAILALTLVSLLATLVAGQGGAAMVGAVLVVALLCAAVYVEVRLSLAGALTVMRGRLVIRDAWRVTRGHFWELFGAYAVLTIAIALLSVVAVAVTNPSLLVAYVRFDPQAIATAAQEQMARQGAGFTAGLIVQAVVGAIVGVVMGAAVVGAVATAAIEFDGEAPRPDALDDEVAPVAQRPAITTGRAGS